jgi:hypothetical protein
MPVTIQNLDVRFDVEGEGDEAVFAKLFAKYVRRWSREHDEEETRARRSNGERSLGDRPDEDKS